MLDASALSESDLITQLICTAKYYPLIRKMSLFGSRSRGSFHYTSDFDVCVYCEDEKEFTRFYFDVDDIDTFYKIDVLRYEDITNDILKREIEKGIVLYESEG